MTLPRMLLVLILGVLMVGSGACALTSLVFAIQLPVLLLLTLLMGAVAWGCWKAIKALRRPSEPPVQVASDQASHHDS